MMNLIYCIHHSDSFWNSVCRAWAAVQIQPYHSTICLRVKCTYWNISYITCGHMEFLTMYNPCNCQTYHQVGKMIQQERRKRRLMRIKKGLEQKETVLINRDHGQLNNSVHLFYANMPFVNKTKFVTQPLSFKLRA